MNELNIIFKDFLSEYSWLVSFISACVALGANYYIRKREAKRENIYQHEMEKIKAEIYRKEEVFNRSLAAISSKNEYFMQKQVESIQDLWQIMIEIRNFSASMNLVYGMFTPDEYHEFVFSDKFDTTDISIDKFNRFALEVDRKAQVLKPLIDAGLWSKFSLYRSFMLRNLFLFTRGVLSNSIQPWYEDNHLVTLCNELLEQYKQNDYSGIGRLGSVLNTMEEIIVLEMREVLSGNKLSKDIIEKSIEIAELSKMAT